MKGSKRGTKVRTWTAYIPQMDLTSAKEVLPIYLTDDGDFAIYVADHIAGVVGHTGRAPTGWFPSRKSVQAKTLDGVKSQAQALFDLAKDILREGAKERVIIVYFNANRRGEGQYTVRDNYKPSAISFSRRPAVSLSYQVLWKAGSGLYRQDSPDCPLVHVGSATMGVRSDDTQGRSRDRPETLQLPWTQEREDFLSAVEDGLSELIERMCRFFGSAEVGTIMDRAIASGLAPALLQLPSAVEEQP